MGSAHYDALLLVLILIGVPLEREDAVRLLELVVGGRALHGQYLVVAPQRHPSMRIEVQNDLWEDFQRTAKRCTAMSRSLAASLEIYR